MLAADLIAFSKRVAEAFNDGKCKGPVHLSGGNEGQLIEHFKNIAPDEWVFSTYRSHYHALLKGIDPEWLFNEILEGRSMCISSAKHKFHSSAIVAGCVSHAVGAAYAVKMKGKLEMVHCFLGDMAATTGAFHEARRYAIHQNLCMKFYVEDNAYSCDTPTNRAWGWEKAATNLTDGHSYTRTHPHSGAGKYVF